MQEPREASVAVQEEIFENQRWGPRTGFSAGNLLGTERAPYSDERGTQRWAGLEDGWQLAVGWAWATTAPMIDPLAEEDGWEYAASWGVRLEAPAQ